MGVELASTGAKSLPHALEDDDASLSLSDSDLAYHVRNALQAVPLGDCDDYNQLVAVLHRTGRLNPDQVAQLVATLKGLSGAVSCINIADHKSLLVSISRMSMWDYDPDVVDALLELIINLAPSQDGRYVDYCLEMLVQNFVPPPSFLGLLKQPRGISRKHQVLSRVHSALKEIADCVPLSPLILVDKVAYRMRLLPLSKEYEITIYAENMLRLETETIGLPIRETVLMAIVDKLIDLDVEIGWDDILQDDSSRGIFEMELDDEDEMGDDSGKDEELSRISLSRKNLGGNLTAEALDSLMVLIFEHLESCAGSGRLSQVFDTLLHSFEKTVLNTYKSKFSQFVIFYACALDPGNCGQKFATKLADIFFHRVIPLTRMSAVAYLASYMARAVFLPDFFVLGMLRRLVDWCLEYCRTQEGDVNPEVHRVFYSACQAVMYVLCFRMKIMMVNPRLKSLLQLMRLEQILKHKLNPLKVCLPSVVKEFLRQAKMGGLFTASEKFIFDDLLESELSRAFGGLERLDMFFPFDPCLLKRCDRYIKPNYRYWSAVKTFHDEDSVDEDSDDEDSDDDDVVYSYMEDIREHGGAQVIDGEGLDIDEFDYAMNKMSITPKNSLRYKYGGEVYEPARMPSRIRPSASPESF